MQNVPVTHKCQRQPTTPEMEMETEKMTTKQSQNLRILMHHKLLKNFLLAHHIERGGWGARQYGTEHSLRAVSIVMWHDQHSKRCRSSKASSSCYSYFSSCSSFTPHKPPLALTSLPPSACPSPTLSSLEACAAAESAQGTVFCLPCSPPPPA